MANEAGAGGGGGYTPPVTSYSEPKPVAPHYYYFNGRRYSSYSSYLSAVQAAQKAAAVAAAAQRAALLRQQQAAAAEAQRRAEQAVKAKAAVAAAAKRAAEAKAIEAARLTAQRQAQVQALAQAAERKQQLILKQMAERKAAAERAAREQALAEKRRLAYAELQRRIAAQKLAQLDQVEARRRAALQRQELGDATDRQRLLQQKQRLARENAQQAVTQRLAERDLAPAGSDFRDPDLLRAKHMGESLSAAELRSVKQLRGAKTTADVERLLKEIAREQALTGGRYYNQHLYQALTQRAAREFQRSEEVFSPLYEQVTKALEKGDVQTASKVYWSQPYQAAMAEYFRLRGTGRTPGAFQRISELSNKIADAYDSYLERLSFGVAAGSSHLLTEQELRDKQAALGLATPGVDPRLVESEDHRGKRVTLTQYLRQQSEMRARQVFQQLTRQRQRMAGERQLGRLDGLQRNPDGSWRDPQAARYNKFLIDGGLSQDRVSYLIDKINTGRPSEVEDARDELVRAAERGVDAYMESSGANATFRRGRGETSFSTMGAENLRRQMREDLLRQVTAYLGEDYGPWQQLSRLPFAGGLLKALNVGFSAAGTGLFDVALPALSNLQALTSAGVPLPLTDTRGGFDIRSAERKASFQNLLSENAQLTPEQWVEKLRALERHGQVGVTGNALVDLGLSVGTDPLIFSPLDRLMRSAMLAAGEVGGARAALGLGLGGGKALAKRTGQFFLPERLSGVGKAERTLIEMRRQLAKASGQSYAEVAALSSDDLEALAKGLLAGKTVRQVAADAPTGLQKWLRSQPVNSQQIRALVQSHAKEFLATRGIDAENALRLGKHIDEALRIEKAAARQSELLRQADELRVAAKGREALDKLRAERAKIEGVLAPVAPLPGAPAGGAVAKANRLEREYRATLTAFGDLAQRTAEAARGLHAREVTDAVQRETWRKQLSEGLEQLRVIDDTLEPLVDGTRARVPGLLSERRQALADYRELAGVEARPFFHELEAGRLRGDMKFLAGRLRYAHDKLKLASTAGQKRFWQRRIGRLQAARQTLEFETRLAGGPLKAAQRFARKNSKRVLDRFPASRVAHWAPTRAERVRNVAEEISARLFNREVDEPGRVFSGAERAKLTKLTDGLRRRKLVHTAALDEFADILPADMNLYEAVTVLRFLMRSSTGFAAYRDALTEVLRQVRPLLTRHGFRDAAELYDFLDFGHIGFGEALGLRTLDEADRVVSTAVRQATGFERKGVARAAREASGRTTAFVASDEKPAVLLAKMRVLEQGIRLPGGAVRRISMREYDEAHTALGPILVRQRSSATMLRRARVLARRNGTEVRAEFDTLREAGRLRSAEGDLAEFMSREDRMLLGGEDSLALWEETLASGELGIAKRHLTAYQSEVLQQAWRELAGGEYLDEAARNRFLGSVPLPTTDRGALRQAMVDAGEWSPKTADEIAAGQRVWPIADEREFWQARRGFTPEWTDPAVLRPLLDNPDDLQAALERWGFFDDGFEELIAGRGLQAVDVQGAVAFGKADLGIKRARTLDELRDWAVQRYGELVWDGKQLTAMPWLMHRDEYVDWLGAHTLSEAGLKLLGVEMEAGLLRPGMLDDFSRVARDAVRRHWDQFSAKLAAGTDVILPEEFTLFSLGVTDELLTTRSWEPFFRRMPLAARALAIGGLQRVVVTLSMAFPIMNLLEIFGLKAALLSLLANDGRWIYAVKREWKALVPDLDEVSGASPLTWRGFGNKMYQVVGDKRLPASRRLLAIPGTAVELPLRLSEKAENVGRLAFARSVAGRTYDDLLASGMEASAAAAVAKLEAHRQLRIYFSILEGATDFEKALNQIIPFFTYHYKNGLMSLRMLYQMPWVINFADKLGDVLEAHARAMWAELYGDVPFPEDDPSSRWLWFEVDGQVYQLDLSIFSDWTRALRKLTASGDVPGFLANFVRVPHPLQQGIWATLTGGMTPWGKPGDWRELSPWFDLYEWLSGRDYADPRERRDLMQMASQMLFFKKFGKLNPVKAKVQQFFAFMELDEDKAWDYYSANPDLRDFFLSNGTRFQVGGGFERPSWFRLASQEDVASYEAALAGYVQLRDSLNAKLDEFYLAPFSPEYRAWKKTRSALIADYLQRNPLLAEVWGFWYTPEEFAGEFADFKTDQLVEDFFSLNRPLATAFKTELEYAQAVLDWTEQRQAFLDAHPDVVERLYSGRNAVEHAWFEQELHWSEILEHQAHLSVQIAKEEAGLTGDFAADKARRDRISFLYELSDQNYALLDAEAFGSFYDLIDTERKQAGKLSARVHLPDALSNLIGRARQTVTLPGRGDFFWQQASPAERAEIEERDAYHQALGKMMDELKAKDNFGAFWTELRKRGLLDRYLAEHPDRKIDMEYSTAIAAVFAKGGPMHFWDNLIAQPNLLRQYLRRNPAKQATYERVLVGKRYFGEMQALWKAIGGDGARFYDELARRPWLQAEYFRRNPEKAAARGKGGSAYALAIGAIFNQSKSGADFYRLLEQQPKLLAEYFRRHPDKAAAYKSGKEYFGYISSWIERLKVEDFAGADALWQRMPAWVHDRYFAKNPDSKMRDGMGGDPMATPRGQAVADTTYSGAMQTWVALLQAKQYERADQYFGDLPDWIKERYYVKHPDQRAKHDLDAGILAKGASYFLADPRDKARYLTPELRTWLAAHGGSEGAMRGLVFAIYRAIPSSEPWLKRTFRERYPELFGKEEQGRRRSDKVLRTLAEHPEMLPFYERALRLQTQLYTEQLRRSAKPPKPLEMVRKRRLRQRSKRRAARWHSEWRHFKALR